MDEMSLNNTILYPLLLQLMFWLGILLLVKMMYHQENQNVVYPYLKDTNENFTSFLMLYMYSVFK